MAFFHRYLTHAKGEKGGKPFLLEQWQQDYIRQLFATDAHGIRKVRTSLLAIPRKNGKSSISAGIALRLLMENEPGCEVYSCAASRDQARLVFDMAKVYVEQSPTLSKHLKVYRNAIVRPSTHGSYKALSAEAGIQHGLSAHGVIFDELHVSNREMWEVMVSSQGARRQPLTVALTTAGSDRKSVCWDLWKYAESVATGAVEDPTFLPALYAAPRNADWKSEKVWKAANPNLGVSVSMDFLRSECHRALEMPAYENTFRQLYLNQWVEQDTRWLQMHHWAAGSVECPVDLTGRQCWAGLDLGSTADTTSFVLLFPLDDGRFWVEPHFWIPQDNAVSRERRDKVPYIQWERDGYLRMTPGNVTDYDMVRADINALARKYEIRQVAIDRWNACQLSVQLAGDGLDVLGFSQGYGTMSQPSKTFEGLVKSGKLLHGGHPVMAWQAGNVAIQSDGENIKPSKARSHERIDSIVAACMAVGIHATASTAASNWEMTLI